MADLLFINLFGLLVIIPLWRCFRRAGLHPAWSLLVFVPVIGVVLVLGVLALSSWPAESGRGSGARVAG